MGKVSEKPSDSFDGGQQKESTVVLIFLWLALIGKWLGDVGPIVSVIEFFGQSFDTFRRAVLRLRTSGSQQGAREMPKLEEGTAVLERKKKTSTIKEGTAVLDRTETSTIKGQEVKVIKPGPKGTTHIGKVVKEETIKKSGVKVTHIVPGVDGSDGGTLVGTDADTVINSGKSIGVIGGKEEKDIAVSWFSELDKGRKIGKKKRNHTDGQSQPRPSSPSTTEESESEDDASEESESGESLSDGSQTPVPPTQAHADLTLDKVRGSAKLNNATYVVAQGMNDSRLGLDARGSASLAGTTNALMRLTPGGNGSATVVRISDDLTAEDLNVVMSNEKRLLMRN